MVQLSWPNPSNNMGRRTSAGVTAIPPVGGNAKTLIPRRIASPPTDLISMESAMATTPLGAGLAIAAAAYAGRYDIQAWQAFKASPPTMRRFYEGGFQASMTKREATLILGVRESTLATKVKEAHRRVMVANHPDSGGSHYLASKINEAKDVMLGNTKRSGSAF